MKRLLVVMPLLLLWGCGNLPKPPGPQSALYDFGIAEQGNPLVMLPVRLEPMEPGPGLGGNGIRYRLAYKNPAQVFTYTESRWVAAPERLVEDRLARRINSVPPARCVMRVRLETFDQVFDAPENSRGLVGLHASLLREKERVPFAQVDIVESANAMQGNARGGVQALTAATDRSVDRLLAWVAETCVPRHEPEQK